MADTHLSRSKAQRAQPTSKPQWACYGRANDGAEMLMGWKCDTRDEAEDIRQDVIYHCDLPASFLTVRRVSRSALSKRAITADAARGKRTS